MLFKTVFFISVLCNLLLLISIFMPTENDVENQTYTLIVTNTQKQCLSQSSHNNIVREEKVYGPDSFLGLRLVHVKSKYVEDSFEFRYGNCFYDSYAKIDNGESIDAALQLYEEQGYRYINIHKNGENDFTMITAKK